jgi:cytoskeletal protein RodZ
LILHFFSSKNPCFKKDFLKQEEEEGSVFIKREKNMNSDALISLALIALAIIVLLLLLNWTLAFVRYTWNAYIERQAQKHIPHQHEQKHEHQHLDEMDQDPYETMPPPSSIPRSARSRSRSRPSYK